MEILLALIFGAAAGLVAQYTVSGRETRGAALAPVVGAFVSGLVWMILTWAGLTVDNPWIWVAAIIAPVVVVFPLLVVLTRGRRARDERERARLKLA